MKGTSVVFRQGSRLMVGDLDKVSVHTAKAVVVFSNLTTSMRTKPTPRCCRWF